MTTAKRLALAVVELSAFNEFKKSHGLRRSGAGGISPSPILIPHGRLGMRVVAPTEQGQERAFVKFVSEGDRFMAGVLFFGRSAVLASANTGGTAEDLELGERLVASIGPFAKRRGLFRR